MRQLSLFADAGPASEGRGRLDAESERLLRAFAAGRLSEGASERSVLRETSQLRSIARECGGPGRPLPLGAVFADVALVGRVLREPRAPISRSTGRTRLRATQRFMRIVGPRLGRDPAADLAGLDAQLPARPTSAWHSAGTLVAGEAGRRRRRGPTLDAADLRRIVEAAGERGGESAARDRALAAVLCFTGLRIEEAVALRWEDIETRLAPTGYYGLTAVVERGGRQLRLPMPGPSADALEGLREFVDRAGGQPPGHVFRAIRGPNRPLGYRAARNVLVEACRRAGLPPAESSELRAGCAHWLRAQGLSEHEVAAVLGLARVRSVDRLLARHAALDAQRRVREQLGD